MACRLFGAKPLPEQMLVITNETSSKKNLSEICIKMENFPSAECIWKCRLWNGDHFVQSETS